VITVALQTCIARDDVSAVRRERLEDALDRGCEDVAAGRVIELET
jgi:predicted transcriptional regulator